MKILDATELRHYLELLYPDPPGEHYLVVSWVVSPQEICSQWHHPDKILTVVRRIRMLARSMNVYIGLGLRHPTCIPHLHTRGTNADVSILPGVWIELDHNAGTHTATNLPTPGELLAFIEDLPFQFSLLIDSTGGYHGYLLFKELWHLDTPEEHQAATLLLRRFQRTIQARAADRGWKVDTTSDLARILRPPGTLNYKSGTSKPVTILHEEALRYNPSDLADAPWLATIEDTYTPTARNGRFPPTPLAPIVDGCAWLRHCREDAATLDEPQWYTMLGIVGRTTEGEQCAHAWSTPYPRYSKEETTQKLLHALAAAGPSTCTSIRYDRAGESYCRECPQWGTIKSPIVLGMASRRRARVAETQDAPARESTPPRDERIDGTAARPARDPNALPYSDYTNALAFVRDHGANLRYCYPWGKWLAWSGTHWDMDNAGQVIRWAKETVKRLARHAEDLDDLSAIGVLLKHVKASLSTPKLKALVENAQSELPLPVLPEDLDCDHWLLNATNGTVDLRTGVLQPHRREDLLTRCIPVAYDPHASCPTWDRFLARIMDGNTTLIQFLQRAVGYALTGVIREHILLILWGSGRNGKSTFLNTLRTLLGPYAMKAPSELLMVSNTDRHPTERADLLGKRLIAAIETEQGRRLAEVFVKEATGGDPIRARRMREDFWEFEPTHKVFLATNHKPVITGTDTAIWERIRLIPFTVTIPRQERDTTLPGKLLTELPGILAWAVRGCQEWQNSGLGEPEEVQHATADYKAEMDVVGQFIMECCLTGSNYRVKAAELYEAYTRWSGERADNQRTWGMALTERGFERKRGTAGSHWWIGITLATSTPQVTHRDTQEYPSSDPWVTQDEQGNTPDNALVTHSDPETPIEQLKFLSRGQMPELGSLGSLGSLEQIEREFDEGIV
jgi:P4 family phage/plasmid primase-like protien